MAVLGSFTQQPREALYYTIDYSCWLDATVPETLDPVPPQIIVSPTTTPALIVVGVVQGTDRVKLLVSGGLDGAAYKIETIVTTDNSQTHESEIKIRVKDF